MKPAFLLLAACCLLFSSCRNDKQPRPAGGRAVEVVLQDVTVRQYSGGEQRFEFQAQRITLDEEAEVLEAQQGIRGRIEAGAFSREGSRK